MMQFVLILFYFVICLFRTVAYPFTLILILIIPWSKKRLKFELLNDIDAASKSFKKDRLKADVAFEISSEGELEQVKPLIIESIKENRLVELLFSSESVEAKCQKLYCDYPDNIRIFRLPLITFSLFPWPFSQNTFGLISAKKLILCRYDFFPELMLLGSTGSLSFILLSATLKNKKTGFFYDRFYYALYNLFDLLVTASLTDKKKFIKHKIAERKLIDFDFRVVQINERLKKAIDTLNSIPPIKHLIKWLETAPIENRFIIGSGWPLEMKMFSCKDIRSNILNKKLLTVVAPHKIREAFIREIKDSIDNYTDKTLPVYVLNDKLDELEVTKLFDELLNNPGILIIAIPGILCELYTLFRYAFVGGGHGRSVHSVLEPYLALAIVLCGPKVHRSTEFDFIKDYSHKHIKIVHDLDNLYNCLSEVSKIDVDFNNRKTLISDFENRYVEIYQTIMMTFSKDDPRVRKKH